MKNLIVILLALLSFTISNSYAQDSGSGSSYKNAIGIKFYPAGVSFKHFLSGNNAIEGIGYFYNRGTRITGLYEIHNDLPGLEVEGLKWYVGPGAHIGFINSNYGGGFSLGVDGVLGLDYKVAEAPINVSVDIQPALELGSYSGSNRLNVWGGIGIRYTF